MEVVTWMLHINKKTKNKSFLWLQVSMQEHNDIIKFLRGCFNSKSVLKSFYFMNENCKFVGGTMRVTWMWHIKKNKDKY